MHEPFAMNTESNESWVARPYTHEDKRPLACLYEVVNGRDFDRPYWDWLFENNPSGKGDIQLAVDGEAIAGQYATMPVKMTVAGRTISAAQSLHTMTHPDYRKQGIFTALARRTYEEIKQKGSILVYGFPNDNSFHGFLKHLNFFVLENLCMRARPLCLEAILDAKVHRRPLSKLLGRPGQMAFDRWILMQRPKPTDGKNPRVEIARTFPKDIDRLAEAQARHFPNGIIRDHRYLSWRYGRHPNRSYEIYLGYRGQELAGYCVSGSICRKGLDIGLIVELYADPSDEGLTNRLIAEALSRMQLKKRALAACLLPAGSPLQGVMRKHGFLFALRRFAYILRVEPEAGLDLTSLKRSGSWHITFGDADFV